MVINNYSRLLVGTIILIIVIFCYLLNLDVYLISAVVLLVAYDLYNIKIIKFPFLFFFCLITFTCNFLLSNQVKEIFPIIIILNLILIFTNNNFKKELFLISVFIFCIILFNVNNINRNIFYTIIFISFFNDTVAFLFGKTIGGPLITPKISPKKTWSGTIISFVLSSLLLFYFGFNILFSAIISLFLFLGDIFFSYIKRHLKINDFSTLLKSHGGILDRLDSMFFITIIFQIYLYI